MSCSYQHPTLSATDSYPSAAPQYPSKAQLNQLAGLGPAQQDRTGLTTLARELEGETAQTADLVESLSAALDPQFIYSKNCEPCEVPPQHLSYSLGTALSNARRTNNVLRGLLETVGR